MATPAREAPLQGTNKLYIHPLTFPTLVSTTATHTYDRLKTVQFSGWHTKNTFKINLTQHEDQQSLDVHLGVYMAEDVPVSEITGKLVDGTNYTYKNIANDTYKFAWVAYGGEVGGKRAVHYGLGVYTGDTGSRQYDADTLGGTVIEITSIEAEDACVFPSTLFTAIAGLTSAPASDLTLATGSYSNFTYLTAL